MLSRVEVQDFLKREHGRLLPLTRDAAVITAIADEFSYWAVTRNGKKHGSAAAAWNAWTHARPDHPGWADPGWELGLPRFPRQVACFAVPRPIDTELPRRLNE